jgi:hypothetical protein
MGSLRSEVRYIKINLIIYLFLTPQRITIFHLYKNIWFIENLLILFQMLQKSIDNY